MDARACGICAGALARVFIDVDPTVVEALLQHLAVVLAERSQRVVNGLLGLFDGRAAAHALNERAVQVVHMQLVHAEELLAQVDIAVHLVQILVNGLDEVRVDARRNVCDIERSLHGRAVLTGLREELQLFDLRGQHGGDGVAEAAVGVIEILKGALAQRAVAGLHVGDIGAVGQRMLVALAIRAVRELHIGIRQETIDIVRSLGHLACGGQQLLLGRAEHMGTAAADIQKIAAIALQLGAGSEEALKRLVRDGHELRRGKAARCVQLDGAAHEAAGHRLILGNAHILIRAAHGVVREVARKDLDLLLHLRIGKQHLCGFAQMTRESGDLGNIAPRLFEVSFPELIGRVNIFDRPFVLLCKLGTFRDLFGFCHSDS